MSIYAHLFAAGYDQIMSRSEKATLRTHREALIPQAKGRVLEIGGGTGANLPFYAGVETLTVTEPERPMVHRLERRLRDRSPEALLVRAPAEDLPFEDGSFDVVVSTLVLCTVDDQPRAAPRTPPRAETRRRSAVHRARTRRRRSPRAVAGPAERAADADWPRLQLQPSDDRDDHGGRLQDHQARARRPAQGATDRQAARRGHSAGQRPAGIADRAGLTRHRREADRLSLIAWLATSCSRRICC